MPAPQLHSPDDLPPAHGYSHVASVPAGGQVWVSGQMGVDADGAVVGGGWEAQTRAAFANLGRALASAGVGWPDVFKLTIFVLDAGQLPTIRRVRDEFVTTDAPPTSSLVQIGGLVLADALIEIEAVAHAG
jgi:enamine deaminase RidA (YjgF/YER057c/UK114 family)